MTDLINRQDAIDAALTFLVEYCGAAFDEDMQKMLCERLDDIPSAEPERTTGNQVHLCGTCKKSIPECGMNHVIFGDGFGNDNVCACSGYEVAKPERKTGKWIPDKSGIVYWICSECGFASEAFGANILYHFCPNCGSYNGEKNE